MQAFRFTPETIRNLQIAAQNSGMSKTAYTEIALKAAFEEDRIEPLAPAQGAKFLGVVKKGKREAEVFLVDRRAPAVVRPRRRKT
jgi:hypothetical protein